MARITELKDTALPPATSQAAAGAHLGLWGKFRLVFSRSIFWAYERGSWQYDVLVLLILAFIFLTPRAWFNDRPTLQMTDLRHRQGVVELGRGKEGWRYLIDARLVESLSPQAPEDAIQDILHSWLQKPFTVKSIVPVKDKNNVVLGYTVLLVR